LTTGLCHSGSLAPGYYIIPSDTQRNTRASPQPATVDLGRHYFVRIFIFMPFFFFALALEAHFPWDKSSDEGQPCEVGQFC
jgi:Na+-driven multidrug efflux pump